MACKVPRVSDGGFAYADGSVLNSVAVQGVSQYVHRLAEKEPAYLRPAIKSGNKNSCILCIDERVPFENIPEWLISIAGSGILLDRSDLQDICIDYNAGKLYTHEKECGAVKTHRERTSDKSPINVDLYGKSWGKKFAKENGIKHKHIGEEKMHGEHGKHDVSVIFCNYARNFNPQRIAEAPNVPWAHKALYVDLYPLPEKYRHDALVFAADVARHSKPGKKIIVPVGDAEYGDLCLDEIMNCVESIARIDPDIFVVDEGFNAPKRV